MSQIECVRKLWFCCGHRLVGHESKCANVHGHNYTLFVYARAKELDQVGRVVDFAILKEKIGGWIDHYWDHSFLLFKKDDKLMPIKDHLEINKPPFICDFNPTAENMANYLLKTVCPTLLEGESFTVHKIELWEAENNKVIVSRE